MSASFVQSGNNSAFPGNNITVTLTGTTAGNTLLAFVWLASPGVVKVSDNVNTGNYFDDASGTSSGQFLGVFRYSAIAGGTTTITLNNSSGNINMFLCVQEWSNIDSLIPFEQRTTVATGSSTSPSANATGTLAETSEVVFGTARLASSNQTWTAGSGFTLDPNLTGSKGSMVEYQVVAGTSATTAGFTITGSAQTWYALSAAYRSAHTRSVYAITSGSSFSAPANWPGVADKAELIGGGGSGCKGSGTASGVGGGGAAYTYANALAISPGASLQIGQGGSTSGVTGTDTWLISNATLLAKGGVGATTSTAGAGGSAASCIPPGVAFSGGSGGAPVTNSTAGGTGGGGAAGPYGAGANGGSQNTTGNTGGTGGGGGGLGTAGTAQTASNAAGTVGGNYATSYGPIASTGGAGGASGGVNAGGNGNATATSPRSSGSGGGGGSSNGSGTGGAGGEGGGGAEWFDGTSYYGSGGGGGGAGQANSGSVAGGQAGLYGAGGGGGGDGTNTGFGTGANGVIIITYTPAAGPVGQLPLGQGRVQWHWRSA